MNFAAANFGLLAFGNTGFGDELLLGTLQTIQIALLAYIFGTILGLLGAVGKLSGGRWLRAILDGYTTIFRAIPELLLILLLYYAGTEGINRFVMAIGFDPIEVNGLVAAVFVLGVVHGAYCTEVLRAAIQEVPLGQIEAGMAYGMPATMRFRRIVLPAMLPYAIPGMANLWLNMTKNTVLIALVGYGELFLATRQAASVSKQYFLFFGLAALIYLLITLASNQFTDRLERHFRRGQQKLV